MINYIRCTDKDREALSCVQIDPDELKDDGTKFDGIKVIKPWGCEIENYRDENFSVWWLKLYEGKETSMHCHPNKSTCLIIVSGRVIFSTLTGEHDLTVGDIMVIEKGAFHKTASSNGAASLFEIESPPNKKDLIRLSDSYGRGQGYEISLHKEII